ncbi:carbon-nitrogen hydrolase family protein [Parvimonas micra]|uniref:Carbon-nitrogen hydrolase family protein n=1 Tax=Parvimonas micra TaxID=33033 RepID=A0A9X3HL01_9FIRM|nr:carbon-nitrogen hydrolase family protein [Parvimonas micra]MCZ7408250.1 carbon-nitrogen hydrolase family protein [Parvimonas micra]MCZ7411337.1 carbon-nitrogen hydrolase family protein [Parvimonas micra]MCZ7412817.1 carbon-nitrogen hydrolase family protein [Parvimonas micra]WBB36850.1 carbon-nitrogen hydrolase family protein [Parvimonas micra]
MKIGLVSYEFNNGKIEYNIEKIEKAIISANGKADLLCFGEAFLQGFDSLSWNYEIDKSIAITKESVTMEKLKKLSEKHKIDLGIGYIEREKEKIYSSFIVIEKGKIIHNYRRITKNWKEYSITDEHYCEGEISETFIYKNREFKIALCGDMWICPEKFKTNGILLWPVYCNFTKEEWENTEQSDYAKQSKLASDNVLFVNSITKDEPISVGGAYYFKNGKIEKSLELDKEDILFVEI